MCSMFSRTSEHNLIVEEPDHCPNQLNEYLKYMFRFSPSQVQHKQFPSRVNGFRMCATQANTAHMRGMNALFLNRQVIAFFNECASRPLGTEFYFCDGKYVHN